LLHLVGCLYYCVTDARCTMHGHTNIKLNFKYNKTWNSFFFFRTIFPRVHWRWWRVWHINLCMDCCSSFYSALFVKAQNSFTCQYPPLHVLVNCFHRSLSAITYNTHQEVQKQRTKHARPSSNYENDFTRFLPQTTSVSTRPYVSYPEDESGKFPRNVLTSMAPHELRLACSLTQVCQYRYIYWLILVQLHVSAFIGHLQVVLRDLNEFYWS